MGMRESKIQRGDLLSTLKSTSLSGFGEKKFYIENIPGGEVSFSGGKFSLYEIIPWGMNFYTEKLPWGKILYIENHPERMCSI